MLPAAVGRIVPMMVIVAVLVGGMAVAEIVRGRFLGPQSSHGRERFGKGRIEEHPGPRCLGLAN